MKKITKKKGNNRHNIIHISNINNINNKPVKTSKVNKEEVKKITPIYSGNKKKQIQIRNPSSYRTNDFNFNKSNIVNTKTVTNQINNNTINLEIDNIKKNQPYAQIEKNKKVYNIKSGSVAQKNILINRLPSTTKKLRYNNGTIGLVNIGNTCYFNSALQNLKNVYPLTLFLLSTYQDYDINGFTYKYCELIANLINQDIYQYFQPRDFFSKLSELVPIFRFGQQNDSNFCIIYILSLLERETKQYKGPNYLKDIKIRNNNLFTEKKKQQNEFLNEQYQNQEKNKLDEFLVKLNQRRNSPIINIFYGFQEDIYKCNNRNCTYINFNFQGISVLNLSIMNNNNIPIYTLEDAIKYYQDEQIHNKEKDFSCPICHKNNILTQSLIISLPKILIINFKRIGEKNFYEHNLDIPMDLKIDYEYEYELTGFIKHIGGANSGHNIGVCKNFFDGIWYVYDDSRVFSLYNSIYQNNSYNNGNRIDTSNGFLFFYTKKDCKDCIIDEEGIKTIKNNSEKLRK